jgi:hypothetical protein
VSSNQALANELRSFDPNISGYRVSIAGGMLVTAAFDYIAYTNTNSTTDTYVYKTGGSSGNTVATVTIVYTDSTKATVSTVTRT